MSRASLFAGWEKSRGPWSKQTVGPAAGNLKMHMLRDDFEDGATLADQWGASYGTFSFTGGRFRIANDTNFNGGLSWGIYQLNESYFFGQVFVAAQNGATTDCYTEIYAITTTPGTDAGFTYDAMTGRLYFRVRVGYFDGGETFVTYNSTNHRWWRMRVSNGTMYWDTSPDGTTWTQQRSTAAPAWVFDTTLALSLNAHRNNGVDNFSEFDNINLVPVDATMALGDFALYPTIAATVTNVATLSAPLAITPTIVAENIPVEIRSDPYILITDKDLEVVGDPLSIIQSIEVTQKFNEPDAGSFKVPAYPEYMEVLQPGNRAVVVMDGEIFSAGPIESPGGYEWSTDSEEEPGVVTVNFADDLSSVASRMTYPNPAQAATAQTSAYYEATANAETVIRNLVNLNAGPGALVARRVPHLVLGAVAGVGSTVVCKTRFEAVTEVSRALASAGGGLGFSVDQVGTDLVFKVFAPQDKTKVARFSRGLGNLISVKYNKTKPTATTAIVGGDGEAETRTIAERTDSGAESDWGRVEKWVAAQSQDAGTGLDQTGDNALVAAGETVQLTTITIDSDEAKYGRDYNMGDLVTVEVYPGIEVEDVVREAKFTYTPEDGRQITILVGTQEATRDPEWVQITNQLASRLSNLERS